MILSLKKIYKSFGSREVLKSVSLECSKGEICGLIGPNGAGKSTLFRIIMGLVHKDSGTLEINSTAPKPLGGIIEKPALYGYLSAFDNIRVFAGSQGMIVNRQMYDGLMEQVGLDPLRPDPVQYYSTGMKQRLGLAIALLNRPECIVLDEPFSGLDPMGIRSVQELLRKLAKEDGIAILVSSHNLVDLSVLCDTLYVINEGKITRSGEARKLLRHATQAYQIVGESLGSSVILEQLSAEIYEDYAVVIPGEMMIEGLLEQLVEEGTKISACVPQTNLGILFES